MNIINLTPHVITILAEDNSVIRQIESSGVARASSSRTVMDMIDGIPINSTVFGAVENLPAPQEDTIYIVSVITAKACPERDDVFVTDDAVRDENGRVIGCRALARV